jgi:hypothetical protein
MYCGAEMPEPAVPSPAPTKPRAMPKGLDKAFQRAMLHGDMRQLRDVLAEVETAPSPGDSPPGRPRASRDGDRPLASKPSPELLPAEALEPLSAPAAPPPPLPPPPPPIDEIYADISQALVLAGGWEDDPHGAVDALLRARALIDDLVGRLEERQGPPDLILPPFRQPYALVVAPPADEARLPELAEALRVDLATARQIALLPYPRAALRSSDQADLADRAARYRRALERPARVVDEPMLRAVPPARLVLTLAADGPWRAAFSASWEPDAGTLAGLDARSERPSAPRLVVVGEVVVTRFRELRGRRKDDSRLSSHGDRRIGVVDLHHDGGVLRVVQGISALDGWPGLDPRSSALAFRGLPEALGLRFPGVTVTGRCVCRPTRQPEAREDGRLEAAGWPAFEEHSRACRLLYEG